MIGAADALVVWPVVTPGWLPMQKNIAFWDGTTLDPIKFSLATGISML
jgi:hypothetical protein